jgi:hypothetical protein
MSGATLSHAEARPIVIAAWQDLWGRDPTEREVAYSMAVASLETGYGRIGQFAAHAAQGQFNWGALEGRVDANGNCPPNMFKGSDQGTVCFFSFPTDQAAAKAFLKTLTQSFPSRAAAIVQAMNDGDATDVARAMRTPPAYYAGTAPTEEGKIAAYAAAIQGQLDQIAPGGLPPPGTPAGSGGGSILPMLAALGLFGAAGYLYAKQRYPRDLTELTGQIRRAFR